MRRTRPNLCVLEAVFPLSTSQILAVRSYEPEAIYLPLGENATRLDPACVTLELRCLSLRPRSEPFYHANLKLYACRQVRMRQTRFQLCALGTACPPIAWPVSTYQIRIVISSEPEAICLPSEDIATDRTQLVPLPTQDKQQLQ